MAMGRRAPITYKMCNTIFNLSMCDKSSQNIYLIKHQPIILFWAKTHLCQSPSHTLHSTL